MTDPSFYIETPNLYISYWLPSSDAHCKFLVNLYSTPEFIAAEGDLKLDAEKAKRQLELYVKWSEQRGRPVQYLVTLKSKTEGEGTGEFKKFPEGELIGQLSMMQGDVKGNENCYSVPDIGWVIHPQYTKRGYATEGMKGLLRYAKEKLGIEEVFVFTDPANTGSRRVAEKLGFEFRGEVPIFVWEGKVQAVYAAPGMKPLEAYELRKE